MTPEQERYDKMYLQFALFDLLNNGADADEVLRFCEEQIQAMKAFFDKEAQEGRR